MLVGEVRGFGQFEPALALDVDAVDRVDHDLGDGRVGEVALDGAVAEDVVGDLGDEAGALHRGERRLFGLDDLGQLLHDERVELLLVEGCVVQARAEPGEQCVLGPALEGGERVGRCCHGLFVDRRARLCGVRGGKEIVLRAALGLGGLHALAELHRVSLRRRSSPPDEGAPAGACGAMWNRLTSSPKARPTGDRRSVSSTAVPWFIDTGTARELGIETSTFRPTVASMSPALRPTRASARLSAKCRCVRREAEGVERFELLAGRPRAGDIGGADDQHVGGVLDRDEGRLFEAARGVDDDIPECAGEQVEDLRNMVGCDLVRGSRRLRCAQHEEPGRVRRRGTP